MIRVKLDYGKKIKVMVPQSWGEVTFDQMMQLQKGTEAVEVFSGIPMNIWREADAESYAKFMTLIRFCQDVPKWGSSLKLNLKGREINFKKIQVETEDAGQFMDAQMVLQKYLKGAKKKRLKDLNKSFPQIIAIYAQKALSGVYEYKEAEKLEKEIAAQPYERVFNVGSFFLTNLSALASGRSLMFQLWIYLVTRFRRARRIFTRNGALMLPFTISLSK